MKNIFFEQYYEEGFNNYFKQIGEKTFKPIDKNIFDTIQDEGLDEEKDLYKISDWECIELDLSEEDKQGLIDFEDDIIDKFNVFDIALKDKYKINLIDLIDYNTGKIVIVKPKGVKI